MKKLIIICLLAISVNCLAQNNTVNNYSQYNPYNKADKVVKSKIITFCSATIVSFALTEYGYRTHNMNYCKVGAGVFMVSFTYHFTFSLFK